LIFHRPRRREFERPRHGQFKIVGRQVPAIRPDPFRRSIPQIPLLRTRICPVCKSFDVRRAERPVVREVAALGRPRRHFSRSYLVANSLGPRPRFIVSAQRHGTYLTRPMAFLAVILENRNHIAEERHRRQHSLHTYQYICFSDSLTQKRKWRIIAYIGVSQC
jgi:hypothetical protein